MQVTETDSPSSAREVLLLTLSQSMIAKDEPDELFVDNLLKVPWPCEPRTVTVFPDVCIYFMDQEPSVRSA